MKKIIIFVCVLLCGISIIFLLDGKTTEKKKASSMTDIVNSLDSFCAKKFLKSKIYKFDFNFPFDYTIIKVPLGSNQISFISEISFEKYCALFGFDTQGAATIKTNKASSHSSEGSLDVITEDNQYHLPEPCMSYVKEGNLIGIKQEDIDGFTLFFTAIYDENTNKAAFHIAISTRK